MERMILGTLFMSPILLIVLFATIGALIGVASLVFSILMIIDCYNREFEDRQLWLIIMILGVVFGFGLIASILYYILVKKKFD